MGARRRRRRLHLCRRRHQDLRQARADPPRRTVIVTAYADNSELEVKEGDAIKRGQIIAKAGDSGAAKSPRLHFELRKDGQPVDPVKYLVPL